MDGEELLGYLVVLAWLGLFVYLPVASVRRAGSLRAWVGESARDPYGSLGSVLIAAGCMAFLLWLLTGGAVPVKLALLAPAGFLVLLAKPKGNGTGQG